jgi:hypothetical protein
MKSILYWLWIAGLWISLIIACYIRAEGMTLIVFGMLGYATMDRYREWRR